MRPIHKGYHIRLLHVTAPDKTRWNSIRERDKEFVQTTEQDIREKGDLLPQRIMDTYLLYADEIEFYYRKGVHEDAQLAATWIRSLENVGVCGELNVISPDLYEKIVTTHNETVVRLDHQELLWEKTVEANS